jgi:hypothetical protein
MSEEEAKKLVWLVDTKVRIHKLLFYYYYYYYLLTIIQFFLFDRVL